MEREQLVCPGQPWPMSTRAQSPRKEVTAAWRRLHIQWNSLLCCAQSCLRTQRLPCLPLAQYVCLSMTSQMYSGVLRSKRALPKGERLVPSQAKRRSNSELAERVKSILASKNLTLYQVSERSAALFGRSSPQYLPHNLYYDLRHGSFSPSLFQLFAFSRISGYRLTDWLRVFGFDVEVIPLLQVQLPARRTAFLDSSLDDPNAFISWLRNLSTSALPAGMVPLSLVLESTNPRPLTSLAELGKKGFLYAKIGHEDALGFPELLPGSIVRVRPMEMDDLLHRARG
jgi:hypothetical protein